MLVQFSLFPVGEKSLTKPVSKVIDLIDKSGLAYQTTAMGTIVEGDYDQIFKLIKRCHNLLRKDYGRIYGVIKIDDRKGAKGRLRGKVESVEKALKRKIKK
ncbi:MAG: hypothetical protein A2142_04490 [candidate division Zixibacteria bacterium RBG_16_48_11]|nr:MAG: hypothetical protein A2142_04490 [candidate division Zixibacteria bacterium RBG_16_48_11]